MSPGTTIYGLPNEVLLEIFDSFRQTFQCERDYDMAWNSNKGWFKLAHVCREWRQVVLTSPSRLQVRLLFTKNRSGRATAIRRLPPLPILVDYRSGAWFAKTQIRMISALAYPDRVCGVAFNMYYRQSKHLWKLLAAMDQPFPALEILELRCWGSLERYSPPPFLSAKVPHLRSLQFIGHVPQLCHILPYATSLVDLTLGLHTTIFSPRDTQLLVHLQGLSSLRRLKVEAWDGEPPGHPGGREDVLLPTLTSLSFAGPVDLLEAYMAGLVAPSLQELRISVYGTRVIPPPTHLTSFIRSSGRQFFYAQISAPGHGINLVMSTQLHSTDDPPFKVIASGMRSILLMGDLFSEPLAAVEDVFLASPFCLESLVPPIQGTFHSHTFFAPFRGAKILRVSPGIEPKVGEMFFKEELSPNLLPALEEIELNATTSSCTPIRIDEKEVLSVLELFKRFVDARQQASHPVKVHWNTARVLPEYFCNTDM